MDESAFPLTAGVRVRPLRVGFLVNPGDHDAVRQVMTVNTSLWGGSFNPMIPVLSRRPRWDVGPLPPPSAKQITRGYLSCWQPDLLVSAVPGAGDRYAAVIDLGDWLSESAEHRSPLGVDAVAVFEAVHRRERRFLLREPRDIVLPVAGDERFADLIACCLGRLPDGDDTERFVRQLAAERVPVSADNLLTAFVVTASRTPMWGPLGVGAWDSLPNRSRSAGLLCSSCGGGRRMTWLRSGICGPLASPSCRFPSNGPRTCCQQCAISRTLWRATTIRGATVWKSSDRLGCPSGKATARGR